MPNVEATRTFRLNVGAVQTVMDRLNQERLVEVRTTLYEHETNAVIELLFFNQQIRAYATYQSTPNDYVTARCRNFEYRFAVRPNEDGTVQVLLQGKLEFWTVTRCVNAAAFGLTIPMQEETTYRWHTIREL
jgi:hypothetical protein